MRRLAFYGTWLLYHAFSWVERRLRRIEWFLMKYGQPDRVFSWLAHQMAMHITIALASATDYRRRRYRRQWPDGD